MKEDRIKRWLICISIIGIVFILITGCSMSYTSKKLTQKNTSNSWSIDFKYLEGDLAHSFNRKDGKPSTIHINSSLQSGSLILQVQLKDSIEEFSVGKNKIDLSSWDNGEFILRIVGSNAENGSVDFTWE